MAFGHPNLEVYSLRIVFYGIGWKPNVQSSSVLHSDISALKIHPLIREQFIMMKTK